MKFLTFDHEHRKAQLGMLEPLSGNVINLLDAAQTFNPVFSQWRA